MPGAPRSTHKTRREIAQLAAKLLAVDGMNSFLAAKRKAALQLGVQGDRLMPTNLEIETALQEYQRLFQGDARETVLRALRETALAAMKTFEDLSPRLVGPVLTGTASEHSEVILHLRCDDPDQVGIRLAEHGIPFKSIERPVKVSATRTLDIPGFRFIAGTTAVVLIVFTSRQRNLTPLSQVDDRPLRRADCNEVRNLLDRA